MEGGWVAGSGIGLYSHGGFVVLADAALSVRGRGTPITHSLGWRGGGVKTRSKTIRL